MSGVQITGLIVPLNGGAFPVFEDINGLGGTRVVADLAGRDAILANFRKIGMVAIDASTGIAYQLIGGILNANWQNFAVQSVFGRIASAIAAAAGDYAVQQVYAAYVAQGNSGAAKSIAYSAGDAQSLTLTANCTLTITGLPAGRPVWLQLDISQDATGSRTLTIATAKTPGGVALALSTTANALDIVNVYWNGTAIYATVAGNAFA